MIGGAWVFWHFNGEEMRDIHKSAKEDSEDRNYYLKQGGGYPWTSKAHRIQSQAEHEMQFLNQIAADEEVRLRYESLKFFERQNRNQND